MAKPLISEQALLDKALDLFRAYGYEGVSLQQLADAAGLEKASLYYRFPGGKEEIALAVTRHVVRWFVANVFEPLKGDGDLRKRLLYVSGKLKEFYAGGAKACLTEMMSIAGPSDRLHFDVKAAMRAWVDAFAGAAREAGHRAPEAQRRAQEFILRLEGALVMARILKEPRIFLETLKGMEEALMGAA